jgi:hypothetical protein
MNKIEVGYKVKIANAEQIEFEVISKNADGSYELEAKIDDKQILRYGNVVKEMLKVII